jgi:hypothetical protein
MSGASAALRGGDDPDQAGPAIRIQLLHVPDCPLVEQVRATLSSSLAKANVQVVIEELEGPYASPTLVIDGVDVTGRSLAAGPACRLDLPTEHQVLSALSSSNREPAS